MAANAQSHPQTSSPAPISLSSDACKEANTAAAHQEDLISRLPDNILTQVLSFLPTESSIATSVLAKRWKHTWISVPCLDFDSDGRLLCRLYSAYPDALTRFGNFVDRVLRLHNVPSLRKVRLNCSHFGQESPRVCHWVDVMVTRAAEIFDLQLPGAPEEYSVLPDSFFNRKNLVELRLVGLIVKIPSFVCFPSLQKIKFKYVHLVNDDTSIALKNLLTGCPVLKSLRIDGGFLYYSNTFSICSSTLRSLKLDTGSSDGDYKYEILIDAPKLRCIDLADAFDTKFDLVNVSSLVKVSLSIDDKAKIGQVLEDRFLALLRKISHVKELTFSSTTMDFLELIKPLENLPMFNNLTLLEVEPCASSWWSFVHLFQFTPNLINCHINIKDPSVWYRHEKPHETPRCLVSSLENVKISHKNDDYIEMGLIHYFFKCALVLKRLSIQTVSFNLEDETNVIWKLQTLQKNSGGCQVEYKNMLGLYGPEIISLHRIGGDGLMQ